MYVGGIDESLRGNSAPEQSSDPFCVGAIIRCFSAMDGFHKQSMTEDERIVWFVARIVEPVPAEGCFAGDDESVLIGGEFEFIDSAFEFPMPPLFAFVIEHTEEKRAGVEVNAVTV